MHFQDLSGNRKKTVVIDGTVKNIAVVVVFLRKCWHLITVCTEKKTGSKIRFKSGRKMSKF